MKQIPTYGADLATAEGINIRWQQGPILGMFNGAAVDGVIRCAIMRLEDYQSGPLSCGENQEAIWHLNAALAALDRRTADRYWRGVMGTEAP